jgi:hypothetical protein
MANKIFSSYSTSKNKDAPDNQQLIIEAGVRHLACIVKGGPKHTIREFELFKVDTEGPVDFEAFFTNCLKSSNLAGRHFEQIKLFVNHEQSLLVKMRSGILMIL